ncbi:colanic acid biosynthesis glycosyltransferase WcaL [Hyphomicrobium methylovorum]|uniref:glycosyltransferase n=1 Tax=Hyphomicrobium methylovorum TaxID=84 RepID=UPI0015E7DE51|nr:glycosyltransferase [Hyphomicrobium methylovorum]MBA2127596.1 colanic acid biosynthesis glycosyltransferase WcaL [Hyphomicrobium methylovorum]
MHKPISRHEHVAGANVAYVVNQYPKVSHAFIRREINALEDQGISVARYAIRGWDDTSLVDPADLSEQRRTSYVLQQPRLTLLTTTVSAALRNPRSFLRATSRMLSMMRKASSRRFVHIAYLMEAAVIARWATENKTDHIHAHFGTNSAEVAMLAHLLTGIPYSFTVHGPEEFDKPVELGLSEKVQNASFACAISSYGRSQLWRWLPQNQWHKIKLIRCGLDERFLAATPEAAPPTNRLVCVGRLCEQKGQLLLVEAAGHLVAKGVDINLVLAGDGEMRANIEKRISELNLRDRVSITGWISSEQVAREIESARALVLPSFAEGLPVVIMEAMALERPVITTYVAGIPELVTDGNSGWLLPAGDVHALTDAMAACLATPASKIHEMGRIARERVLNAHNINTECKKLAALFQASALSKSASAY